VLAIFASSVHLEMNCKDSAGALRMLYECVPFAEAACLPADLGMLYKRVAECEALHGDGEMARAYAARAQRVFPGGSLGWIDAHCFKAMADLADRNYSKAAATARKAVSGARRIDNDRRLGCGLRLLAEAYAGLDRLPESSDTIDEAIALLEGHTHSRALSIAYRLSAKVTGNPKHRRLGLSFR
jgi:tetratricopeptide (TPR) repeat protein